MALVVLACVVMIMSNRPALANPEIVIGDTVTIAEVSVLTEIEQSAARADWQSMVSAPDKWSGFRSSRLPMAQENAVRIHRPFYTLDHDISDQHGRIIYPRGYTFNPLAHVRLPSRILVVGHAPRYGNWLAQHAQSLDMILTAGGDPMALAEQYQRPVFILEPALRERLGVTVVPSIVEQQADAFHITESLLDHPDNSQLIEQAGTHDAG
jgi:conjugal transfer pilus assembly protein TraU